MPGFNDEFDIVDAAQCLIGGGAVALAAVLAGKLDCQGKTVCVVCSGGNVDLQMFAEILTG